MSPLASCIYTKPISKYPLPSQHGMYLIYLSLFVVHWLPNCRHGSWKIVGGSVHIAFAPTPPPTHVQPTNRYGSSNAINLKLFFAALLLSRCERGAQTRHKHPLPPSPPLLIIFIFNNEQFQKI